MRWGARSLSRMPASGDIAPNWRAGRECLDRSAPATRKISPMARVWPTADIGYVRDYVAFREARWSGSGALAKLVPPAKLHVVLADHLTDDQLLGYENALAIGALLTRADDPRELIVEIHSSDKLDQHRNALPYWERSGACSAWWIEGEGEPPAT